MPQGNYVEEHVKRYGKRLDTEERLRKREAREVHKRSSVAQSMHGRKAKLLHQQRYSEKVALRKLLKQHDERKVKAAPTNANANREALPSYLLDREEQNQAKVLSSALKQRRKDKAAKFAVPLPKVRGISEEEAFRVIKTGKKTQKKGWKRMVTKATFVGECEFGVAIPYRRLLIASPSHLHSIHSQRTKDGEIRSTHGTQIQEGKCDPSRTQSHIPTSNHWRKEESPIAPLHPARRAHKGYNHRSQRVRVGTRYDRRQGSLGKVCPGDQQSR